MHVLLSPAPAQQSSPAEEHFESSHGPLGSTTPLQHVYVLPSPKAHVSPVGLELSSSLHVCASPPPAQQSSPDELQRSSSHSPLARTLAVWLQHWYTQPPPPEHSVVVLTGVRPAVHLMVSSPIARCERRREGMWWG